MVVKDEQGYHHFYQNGHKVHDDRHSIWAPSEQPWNETDAGLDVPIRLRVPTGGLVGEFWIVGRALAADEIAADFQAKRLRYVPALPGRSVELRDMDTLGSAEAFSFDARRATGELLRLLGPFPTAKVPLSAQMHGEEDCGGYIRRRVSIQVQPQDRMPAYLLVPKQLKRSAPAIICFYGTTAGALCVVRR